MISVYIQTASSQCKKARACEKLATHYASKAMYGLAKESFDKANLNWVHCFVNALLLKP